ncbi:MAG: DUF1127 domain-containing protein [Hyphomicrobiaceae bacterium]
MSMNTTFAEPTLAPVADDAIGQATTTLKRIANAYSTWREQQRAIAHLHSMNDHLLKDIGVSRSEITARVKGLR